MWEYFGICAFETVVEGEEMGECAFWGVAFADCVIFTKFARLVLLEFCVEVNNNFNFRLIPLAGIVIDIERSICWIISSGSVNIASIECIAKLLLISSIICGISDVLWFLAMLKSACSCFVVFTSCSKFAL